MKTNVNVLNPISVKPINLEGLTYKDIEFVLEEGIITKEDLLRFRKMNILKAGTVVTLVGMTIATSANLASHDAPQNQAAGNVHKIEKKVIAKHVSPDRTKVLSEVVYNDVKVPANKFKTESGKPAIGQLTEKQQKIVQNKMIRTVSIKNLNSVKTSTVTTEAGKESFEPFVTYEVNPNSEVFVPQDGQITKVESDEVEILHIEKGVKYYSIMKGVNSNLKMNQKVTQGELAGKVNGTEFKFAVAKNISNGQPYNFIHPNEFVDSDMSKSYRYGTYKYSQLPPAKLSKKVKDQKVIKEFNAIPDTVKNSIVVRGAVIDNESQLKLLKAKSIFYSSKVLPLDLIKNGKAIVSPQVRAMEPMVRKYAKQYDVEYLTEFLLAILQQESGGKKSVLETDPFQSSESKYGKKGMITKPEESTDQAVKHLKEMLGANNMFDEIGHGDIRQAVHSYNFGGRVSRIANEEELGYSIKFMQEQQAKLAEEYHKPTEDEKEKGKGNYVYGNIAYVADTFRYFEPAENWEDVYNQNVAKVRAAKEEDKKMEDEQKAKQNAVAPAQPATQPTQQATQPDSMVGIDVSKHQKYIDWNQVAKDSHNIKYALIKATQGTNYSKASYFLENAPKAAAVGLKVGAYHYATFSTNEEALAEAEYFFEQISKVEGSLNYPLALDLEENVGGVNKKQLTDAALTFMEFFKAKGYQIMLYTGDIFLDNNLEEDRLKDYPFWIARYGNTPNNKHDIHQFSDKGTINGISTAVDMDVSKNLDLGIKQPDEAKSEEAPTADTTSDKEKKPEVEEKSEKAPTANATSTDKKVEEQKDVQQEQPKAEDNKEKPQDSKETEKVDDKKTDESSQKTDDKSEKQDKAEKGKSLSDMFILHDIFK